MTTPTVERRAYRCTPTGTLFPADTATEGLSWRELLAQTEAHFPALATAVGRLGPQAGPVLVRSLASVGHAPAGMCLTATEARDWGAPWTKEAARAHQSGIGDLSA